MFGDEEVDVDIASNGDEPPRRRPRALRLRPAQVVLVRTYTHSTYGWLHCMHCFGVSGLISPRVCPIRSPPDTTCPPSFLISSDPELQRDQVTPHYYPLICATFRKLEGRTACMLCLCACKHAPTYEMNSRYLCGGVLGVLSLVSSPHCH